MCFHSCFLLGLLKKLKPSEAQPSESILCKTPLGFVFLTCYYTDQWIQILRGPPVWTSTKPSSSTSLKELFQNDNCPSLQTEKKHLQRKSTNVIFQQWYSHHLPPQILTQHPLTNGWLDNKRMASPEFRLPHALLNIINYPHSSFLIKGDTYSPVPSIKKHSSFALGHGG